MQSDDDLQTTLSKWPFILGDILMVATALAIAILGQWQLTDWQVAACVVSVALGAALFVLPYVVEFQVRVREASEEHSADVRILRRQGIHFRDELEALSDRIEVIEAQDQIKALSGRIEGLEAQPTTELIETLRVDLAAVRAQVAALEAQVAKMPGLFAQVGEVPGEAPVRVSGAEPPAEEPASGPQASQPTKAVKVREPRKRRTLEPRLLERAIESKSEHSSAAVSRIIEAKNHSENRVGAEEQALSVDRPEDEAPAEVEPFEEPAAETAIPAEASSLESVSEAAPGEREEDMFAGSVPPQVSKRARIRKSDTVVVAAVFIGIGNKPYIRGGGAGLNWESGVPMEFEEIGKWRWLAPVDMGAPVEIQLYRNDEEPDTTGRHRLEPGGRLELSPVF